MIAIAPGRARVPGQHGPGLPRLPWVAVPVGVVLAVAVMAVGWWLKESEPAGSELSWIAAVQQGRSPALDMAALVLRYGLSMPVGIGWLVLTGTLLWAHDRSPRRALAFIALAVPGWLATSLVKAVVERPRPRGMSLFGQFQEVGPHSFPSAHAALGAGLACAVVLVFCWPRGAAVRVVGVVLGLAFAVVAGWSRVYLGVHHPGDVLGSIVLTVAVELVWLPLLARLLPSSPDTTRRS